MDYKKKYLKYKLKYLNAKNKMLGGEENNMNESVGVNTEDGNPQTEFENTLKNLANSVWAGAPDEYSRQVQHNKVLKILKNLPGQSPDAWPLVDFRNAIDLLSDGQGRGWASRIGGREGHEFADKTWAKAAKALPKKFAGWHTTEYEMITKLIRLYNEGNFLQNEGNVVEVWNSYWQEAPEHVDEAKKLMGRA